MWYMRPLQMRGFIIFPQWVLATRPFRTLSLPPGCELSCLFGVLFIPLALVVPAPTHKYPLPQPTHPFFVNTDYVCGLSQTLFVKLRILQQNIFGDKCCTVFVSSIFVYCYFEENNMLFFLFLFLFLLISCLFILKKMLHVT